MANSSRRRMPLSLGVLLFVNVITLLLSIVVLGMGIWLTQGPESRCSSRLHWFMISIGVIMFLVSLLGMQGARRASPGLLWAYLIILTIAIILLIVFTIFAFLLKSHGFGSLINAELVGPPDVGAGGYANLLNSAECHALFLQRFRRDWGHVATVSLVVLILLLLLYIAACSAFLYALRRRLFHTLPY